MPIRRNRLYTFALVACLSGYIWLYFSISKTIKSKDVELCLFKKVTNIPCPSCGSTRSVMQLTQGHFSEALLTNPLGYLIAVLLIVTPIWLIIDVISKGDSLHQFYLKTESVLRKPAIAIPLISLVLLNWIWNIMKGL